MKAEICAAVLFTLLAFSSTASAATYYIDFENGSDADDGLAEAAAWKHAPVDRNAAGNPGSTDLQPGDTLLFKGGVVYKGTLEIDGRYVTGAPGSPITLKGDGWGSGKAILDGSDQINGAWIKCQSPLECMGNPGWNSIYHTDITSDVGSFRKGFYQNDYFLWYSQDPNPSDPFNYDEIADFRTIPYGNGSIYHNRTAITDPRHFVQSDASYWNGSYVAVWRIPNVVTIKKVTGYDPASHTIFHENLGGDIYDDRDTYYSMLNHLSLIDIPGEYYFDEAKKRLYVWPKGSGVPEQYNFSVVKETAGIYAYYVHDLVVEGFVVQKFVLGIRVIDAGGGITPERVAIRNNEVRNLKSDDWYAIQVSGNNITVENNRVLDCQRAVGIIGGGSNILIKNNTVKKTSRQGIWFMGTSNSAIIGNTVTDILGTHSNPISIYLNCRDILVANNKIYNSMNSGTIQESQNLTFVNNFADSNGAFHSWGDVTNIVFLNNVYLQGVYFDASDQGIVFKNNIVNGGGGAGDHTHNIYTWLSWWQSSPDDWTPGEGELVGPIVNNGYTGVDMSEIFVNAPRFDAEITSFYNASALHVDDYYSPLVAVGDYAVIDNDTASPRRVVSKSDVIADAGNSRVRIGFSPEVIFTTGKKLSLWKSNANFVRDYSLRQNSSAIDEGTDVSVYFPKATFPDFNFNFDCKGVIRPQGSGWDIGVYEYAASYHRADSNQNSCIEINELLAFISRWKLNNQDVSLREIIEAIGTWKGGCL